jgi:hypothetical protein
MRVSDNALRKLIKGTFLATLLLAAMEGGKPFNEATWILVGTMLTTVVNAYPTHMSGRHEGGLPAYFGSLYHGIMNDLPRIIGAADRRDPRLCGASVFAARPPEPRRQSVTVGQPPSSHS